MSMPVKTGRFRYYGSYENMNVFELPGVTLSEAWDRARLLFSQGSNNFASRLLLEEEWSFPQPQLALPADVERSLAHSLDSIDNGHFPNTAWIRVASSYGSCFALNGTPSGIRFLAQTVSECSFENSHALWGSGAGRLAAELEGFKRDSVRFKFYPGYPMIQGELWDHAPKDRKYRQRYIRISASLQDWKDAGFELPKAVSPQP